MATVATADPKPEDSRLAWHCKVKGSTGSLLPDEWLAGARAPGDPTEGLSLIGSPHQMALSMSGAPVGNTLFRVIVVPTSTI